MKRRCLNPNSTDWARYGGRGITVHAAWVRDFSAFLGALGPKPSLAHSLDRIDPNGNYEPGNVRWATAAVQQRNKAAGIRLVTIGSETLTLSEWARRFGVTPSTLSERLSTGWTDTELMANWRPRRYSRNPKQARLLTIHGVTKSITEWSRHTGVNVSTLKTRLSAGWAIERAINPKLARRPRLQ